LTQAFGIGLDLNGSSLIAGPIAISARPADWHDVPISVGRRIGITRAVELPWRFTVTGSPFLSAPVRP
jgi:DNA-3-methyladenine glycosylase